MLISLNKHLTGAKIVATDGDLGHVRTTFFDDHGWVVRYLVADAGPWLSGREVLVSPYSVREIHSEGKQIEVSLNREQIKNSPPVDTHQPISRQHELDYLRHFSYPRYWEGGELWGMSTYPMADMAPRLAGDAGDAAAHERARQAGDLNLRSSAVVTGYEIQASDASIGHIQDFIFDDKTWAIRYVVVDTRNWWPGGRKVLIATHWIESIDWATSSMRVDMTRQQVKDSPEFHEAAPLDRGYEQQLHDLYGRRGYWDL